MQLPQLKHADQKSTQSFVKLTPMFHNGVSQSISHSTLFQKSQTLTQNRNPRLLPFHSWTFSNFVLKNIFLKVTIFLFWPVHHFCCPKPFSWMFNFLPKKELQSNVDGWEVADFNQFECRLLTLFIFTGLCGGACLLGPRWVKYLNLFKEYFGELGSSQPLICARCSRIRYGKVT